MNELEANQILAATLLADIIDAASPDDGAITSPIDVLPVIDAIAEYCKQLHDENLRQRLDLQKELP